MPPERAKPDASLESEAVVFEAGEVEGFAVGEAIARGGFGSVHRATRHSDGQLVAIKFALDCAAGALAQLEAEGEALARCSSGPAKAFVPRLLGRGRSSLGHAYLVLEHIAAPTLAERLADSGGRPLEGVFPKLSVAIVRAMDALRRNCVVHRDLKPENIFVLDDEKVCVFDFGMAFHPTAGASSLDADWVGTPEYMSPEQCEPGAEVGFASDLYCLGVILYEMLAGYPPFVGSESELREQHSSRRPPNLSRVCSIYEGAAGVVHRCLAKDPQRRFATPQALERALVEALKLDLELERSRSTRVGGAVSQGRSQSEADGDESAARRARPTPLAGVGENDGSASDTPAKSKRRGRKGRKGSKRERQMVGLLWIRAEGSVGPVKQAVSDAGGVLAHTSGATHVAAFGHECGDNLVRAALYGARRLFAIGVSARVIVDVAAITVQTRSSGARTYVDPSFTRTQQYPPEGDAVGLYMTKVAAELVPETIAKPGPRPGVLSVSGMTHQTQATVVRETSSPFFGHDELRSQLLDSVPQASKGRPVLASIEADAGMGKSLLASELRRCIADRSRRIRVEALRALEPIASVVDSTVDDLLRRLLNLPKAAPVDGGHHHFVAVLGREFVEEVELGLRIALGWIDDDARELESLRAAPGALRSTAVIAVGRTLRKLAQSQTLAIIVDDAQFADDTLLDALEFATMREGAARLWVCLLARPSLHKARPTIGARAQVAMREKLGPLEPGPAGELARQLLEPARGVSDTAIELLFERTRGVPLLLVELIRGLRRDGVVRPMEHGTGWYLATDELQALPALPAVQWLASCELEALPTQLVAHARLAAVLGNHFSDAALEGILLGLETVGVPLDTQLDASIGIDRLCKAGVLIRDGRALTRFRHALLRDTLYEQVDGELKTQAHGVAFEFFAADSVSPEWERLSQIAHHASGSGRKGPAANAFLRLADVARDRHAYVEAETLYGKALEHVASDDARRTDLVWRHGMMRFRVGRNDDAVHDLEIAMELAHAAKHPSSECAIMLDLAMVLDWQGNFRRSAATVAKADELAGAVRDALTRARIDLGFGRAAFRANDFDKATRLLLQVAEATASMGDEGYESHVIALMLAGACLGIAGDGDRSEATFERAIEAARSRDDLLHLGSAYMNRAIVWFSQNRPEPLLEDFGRVLAIARKIGSASLEALTVYNLGEVSYALGDYEKAAEHAGRAVELNEMLYGTGELALKARLLLGRVSTAMGRYTDAAAMISDLRSGSALETDASDHSLSSSDALLAELVELTAKSSAGDDEWADIIERSADISIQGERLEVLEFRAAALARAGRVVEAREVVRDALALAEEVPNLMKGRLNLYLQGLESAA